MESDHWNDCINSILNMLEELLIHNHKAQSKSAIRNIRKISRISRYTDPCWMPSTNNQHRKRLREFGIENRNRKILRASNATESIFINRDTNINGSEISAHMNESCNTTNTITSLSNSYMINNNNINQRIIATPIYKSKPKVIVNNNNNNNNLRFNYSNNIKSQLYQWLQQFNSDKSIKSNTILNNNNSSDISLSTKQLQLESEMKKLISRLKLSHDLLDISSTTMLEEHLFTIKYQLCLFFNTSSEWMNMNTCYSLMKLFPDWSYIEDYLYGLMGYVKAHEEMLQIDIIQRSGDLLTDINNLQMTIDNSSEIYGTQLSSNGSLWKEMKWWVDDSLLSSTKYWYSSICNDVHEEIFNKIMKNEQTEKSINCIVSGLELIISIIKFIGGSINIEQMKSLHSLVMIYTQWLIQQTESNNENQLSDLAHYQRTSLHYLQLIDNETRVINTFHTLILEYQKHFYQLNLSTSKNISNELPMMALPSLLVNIVFNIVTFINQQSSPQYQLNIKRSNIMRTTFLPLFYLEKSLVTLTESFISLYISFNDNNINNNKAYEQRIQWLINLLDDTS